MGGFAWEAILILSKNREYTTGQRRSNHVYFNVLIDFENIVGMAHNYERCDNIMSTNAMRPDMSVSQRNDELNMHIVFRVKEALFSINGSDILSIQQFPDKLLNVPHAPGYLRGSHKHLGDIFSVIDLRKFFDWSTIQQEYDAFTEMIDLRKQDHVNWVEALRKSHKHGEKFHLARDCHQCALGKWRDGYQTNSPVIQRLLRELDTPHGELHAMADRILGDQEAGDKLLEQIDRKLVPEVLKILDMMKQDFRDREFREMLLLLRNEACVALTVDEILGVEPLSQQRFERSTLAGFEKDYIRGIRQRTSSEELVIELDVPMLLSHMELKE